MRLERLENEERKKRDREEREKRQKAEAEALSKMVEEANLQAEKVLSVQTAELKTPVVKVTRVQERKRELIDRDRTKFDEDLQRQEELERIESLFAARAEKLRQEEEERRKKEEEERKRREEEEKKRQEEEARQAALEAEEEKKRQEEAARQQRSDIGGVE